MVTFVVPEHQSVAHFALGILLDRATLKCIGCNGQHQLTISLVQEDITLLQEMGIVQGDCASIETASPEVDDEMAIRSDFEKELTELQRKVEAGLVKAKLPCALLSSGL